MPPRQRIVLNPGAGSVEDDALERRLAALPDSEVVRTRGPGDAEAAARQACQAGFQRVVAAGGDGTMHEVLQGIANHFDRIQLGLIPLGTGNDFARSLAIPADLEPALEILQLGHERAIDAVRLTTSGDGGGARWLLNASGAGFSAIVSDRADSQSKEGWGAFAYSIGAVKALPELQVYRLRLQVDDAPVQEIRAWAFVVANGTTIAGGIPIAPDASVSDGRAELMVVPEMPVASLAVLLPRILLGKHLEDPGLLMQSGRRFHLEADPPMPVNADGEPAGTTPALYELFAGRVRFVTRDRGGRDDGAARAG